VREEDPRLPGDLRKHWRTDMTFASRPFDKRAKLLDSRFVLVHPLFDGRINFGAAAL